MEVVANYPLGTPLPRDHLQDEGVTAPEEDLILPGDSDHLNGRANRSSSSPSTLEEDLDYPLDNNELEEGNGRSCTPRKISVDSGQSDVDFTSDQRQSEEKPDRGGHGSDQLDVESTKSSIRGSVDNGSGSASDASSLGTPIIEQLVNNSPRGQILRDQLHNHNLNNNMKQQQSEPEKTPVPGEAPVYGGSGADVEDLASQLAELQTMVKDLREGFSGAMEALTMVQYGDRILEQKVDTNKAAHEQQLADVVQMVLALKCEFGGIVGQLAAATDSQQQLRTQVDHLQYERDILLEELEQHGVISENVRQKYHSGRRRPNGLTRGNESSLSVLLERGRSMFNTTNNGNSDQDSGVNTYHQGDNSTCGEVTPPNVSPMVQSYIAGLQNGHQEDVALEDNYESDSSLTQAANKSLDMSRSLGDKCAELTNVDSSDDEELTAAGLSNNHEIQKKRALDSTSPPFKRPTSPKRTPPHEKNVKDLARSRVAFEVLETERKYCSCLWTILDHFANPLKEAAILPNKETSVLFPECLSRIYEHHCAFLQRLEERVANWKCYGVVGDVFSTFIDNSDYDVLVQYRAYVTEFPSALSQLKKSCRHSLRFRKFLRKCQADPICEGLDLSAFLLTPVQRIPRYVLLLKQLMKYTPPEHIDYYYVDSCLSKLGTFLSQLNDSIEYSMKIVADDVTPKSKRKLRVGSLRSSSSSFEGMPLSSATRDSGVQSSCDNNSVLSNSSNNGRMFQVTVAKDLGFDRPLGVPAERPLGVPEPSFCKPDSSQSNHNGNYDSRTMPSMGTRRQRERLRRPKSSDAHAQSSGDKEGKFSETRHSAVDEHVFLMPRPLPPRSAGDSSSLGDSFNGHLPSGFMPPWKNGSFNERRQDMQSPQFRVQSPPVAVSSQADIRTNTSTTSMRSLPVTNSRQIVVRANHSTPQIGSGSLHKSLMNIPGHDYGIYGNESEDSSYTPTVVNDANVKRRALKLTHRSRSQGQLVHSQSAIPEPYSGSTSPTGTNNTGSVIIVPGAANLSQHHINLALARSMADDVPRRQHQQVLSQSLPSSEMSQSSAQVREAPQYQRKLERPRSCLLPGDPALASTKQQDPDPTVLDPSEMRPRSSSTGHKTTVVPVNSDLPDRPRENVWDDSTADDSVLNASELVGVRRKETRKKKKDRQKKGDESITSEGGRRKGGFKDSLRNIFFKKRKTEKDKSLLQDVLAEDTQVRMTSLKIPLKSQDSVLNISPSSAPKPSMLKKDSKDVGNRGMVPKVEITGPENERQPRLKKRPHSICYGSILRSPQEKKSNLKSSSSLRSSLGSKVVEIGGGVEYPDNGDVDKGMSSQQVAPPKDSLIVTSRTDAPEFSTYEDENGDPCSAV